MALWKAKYVGEEEGEHLKVLISAGQEVSWLASNTGTCI